MILMIAGVGLFGVLTGLFAKLFVQPDLRREDADISKLATEIRPLRERIGQMEDKPGSEHAHLPEDRE